MGGTADWLRAHGYDGSATLRARWPRPAARPERGLTRSRSTACGDVRRAAVDAVVEATR